MPKLSATGASGSGTKWLPSVPRDEALLEALQAEMAVALLKTLLWSSPLIDVSVELGPIVGGDYGQLLSTSFMTSRALLCITIWYCISLVDSNVKMA